VKSFLAAIGMIAMSAIMVLLVLTTQRQFIEARYIPSTAMEPTLTIGDRLLIDKVKCLFKRPYERGEIVVFYAPSIATGIEPNADIFHQLGNLIGHPALPKNTVFIKRIIGLPGDTIRVQRGEGVYVNNELLYEFSYLDSIADYDLDVLGDKGGQSTLNTYVHPYGQRETVTQPIVVPEGQLFVLGDNRNNSEDSHVFGMISIDKIVGRAIVRIFPNPRQFDAPVYKQGR